MREVGEGEHELALRLRRSVDAVAQSASPAFHAGFSGLVCRRPMHLGATMLARVAVGPPSTRSASGGRPLLRAGRARHCSRACDVVPRDQLRAAEQLAATGSFGSAVELQPERVAGSMTSAAYRPCCWCELGPKWSCVNTVRSVWSFFGGVERRVGPPALHGALRAAERVLLVQLLCDPSGARSAGKCPSSSIFAAACRRGAGAANSGCVFNFSSGLAGRLRALLMANTRSRTSSGEKVPSS